MKLIEQKLAKIKDKIDAFINYGIDLREICERYEKISNDLTIDNNQEVNNYVKKLDEIEMELSKYNRLLNLLINFNEIYKQTLFYKIERETIKNIVKQVIDSSGNVICLNNNQDDVENQLLNKIYKMIYDIMKLEIVSVNETNLFNYFADKDLSKQFLNEFIKKDLIRIKNKFSILEEYEYDSGYSLKLLSINADNLDECYSLETLKLILRYDTSNRLYKIDIDNKFKNLLSRHKNINNRVGISEDNIKYNEIILEILKTELNKNKKKYSY